MDETKKYRITLQDGTSFIGMPDGAGNYIINEEIPKETFSEWNLSEVTISDDNMIVEVYTNQVLRTHYFINGHKTFIRFSDMTELEQIKSDYNAKLDYIACMTGVDLDE